MKAVVVWLALHGFINFHWFRVAGTWIVIKTGAAR